MESDRKRRVLFIGEANFLATGFSTYWHEVIKRLHETGEFEIAELGSYAHDDDQRCRQVPWKFYPVAPARSNQQAMQKYMANQTSQFGEWRFDDVCLDFKPDIVCVPPETKVETPNGVRNIENIVVGDTVISHTGKKRRVIRTMRSQHNGMVVKIYPHNDNQCYTFTPNHPILAIKSKKRTCKQRDVQSRHNIEDAEFVEAKDLCQGDYVLIPIYRPDVWTSQDISITHFLKQFITKDGFAYPVGHENFERDNGIPEFIQYSSDFGRLLGYYCAEGSGSGSGVQFSFNVSEKEYIEDVLRLMSKYFKIDGQVFTSENCSNVRFNSVLLEELFKNWFGGNAHEKHIPEFVYTTQRDKFLEEFLSGYIKGDGCYKSDTVSCSTASNVLARQIRQLFARLGVKTSIARKLNKPTNLVKTYRTSFEIECYGQYARIAHGFIAKHSELPSRKSDDPKWIDKGSAGWINENYIIVPIRRVRTEPYRGQVYNLEVENDNSYVTGFAVHNCGIRDWWMDEFVLRSPFRQNFSFVWMPTIDGEPQRELWLDSYRQCDRILTYSEYGMDLLRKTARRGTDLVTIASPGADLETFKPPDNKRDHKARLGIDPNSLIVGTVMRNQKRKLYYDLIEAFSRWLNHSKTKGHVDLTKRTFLYLHTSYPDVGYDIGKAIRDFKIGNKVIMTYLCSNCQTAYPSFFAGELMVCRKCGKLAAHPPNANHSCPRNVLADIIKVFDLYVQYSICLHPETPIMTANGWEDIGNIVVGDKVVGRDGKLHRVYKTLRNKPGKCFDIKVKGRPWSATATDNHPWLIVDRTGLSKSIESVVNRERYHRNRGTECPKLQFAYKRTDELRPGDLLASRIPTEEVLPDYDLPLMDENMAYYIGLFAADGHANETCGQCTITSHSSEADDVLKISHKIAQLVDKNAHQQSTGSCDAVVTNICDTGLRDAFRAMCYHADRTKQLPIGCHLWPIKLQRALIQGLMYGDGHQKKEWLNVYCTTSVHIAKMVGPILERLGWYYSCSVQYRDGNRPMYRFEIRTDGQRKSHETLYRDGFVLTKVESSNQSDFDGDVITIDVEDDHNYNTICGMSHNCEGFGMPCVEAQACGVPVAAVDYSAMQDHLKCPGSITVDVERFFWEAIIETEQKRALPSNTDFVSKLDKFLKQSEAVRDEKAKQTRAYIEELVTTYGQEVPMRRRGWERTAAIWGQVIRETKIKDQQTTWLCQTSKAHHPNLVPPSSDMNNSEFVNWVIGKVWNRPDMLRTHFAGEWLKSLNSGSKTAGDRRVPFDRKAFVEHFMEMVQQANVVEEKRLASLKREILDQVNVTVI